MNSALFECSICMDRFNEADRIPHMLSCGHTYCALCLSLLLKENKILCPQDRTEITVTGKVFPCKVGSNTMCIAVASLAKNFALLDIVRATAGAPSSIPPPAIAPQPPSAQPPP